MLLKLSVWQQDWKMYPEPINHWIKIKKKRKEIYEKIKKIISRVKMTESNMAEPQSLIYLTMLSNRVSLLHIKQRNFTNPKNEYSSPLALN